MELHKVDGNITGELFQPTPPARYNDTTLPPHRSIDINGQKNIECYLCNKKGHVLNERRMQMRNKRM